MENLQQNFAGKDAWYGLGSKLENVNTAEEAIKQAGLDWTVSKRKVFLKGGQEIPNQFATVRDDIGTPLGMVGKVYKPVQNVEGFKLYDEITQGIGAQYHTAGHFRHGARVWILAKLPGVVRVVGDDITEKFMLFTNTHDGSASGQVLFTPIRVVCQNTLNAAIKEADKSHKFRHTASAAVTLSSIKRDLGIVNEYFEVFGEAARAMAGVQVNGEGWRKMLRDVGITPADESKDLSKRTQGVVEAVSRLFESGRGNDMPGVKGTAWAAYNALTEYADHERGTRTEEGGPGIREQRADALLFGSGAKLKQKAWDAAAALIA